MKKLLFLALLLSLNTYAGFINIPKSGSGASTLAALTDVNITVPTASEILVYDAAAGKWIDDTLINTLGSPTIGSATISTFNVGKAYFDTNPTVGPYQEGKLYYDTTWKTLSFNEGRDVNLQIGQEELVRCFNNTASQISNGQAVYSLGAYTSGANDVLSIGLARADVSASSYVLGVATQDIPAGNYGMITVRGNINDLDTNAMGNVGDVLYLSSTTAGALTNTAPVAPAYKIKVATLLTKNALGRINVRIGSAYRLGELADVTATNPNVDDTISWNGLGYVNKPFTAITGGNAVTYYLEDIGSDIGGYESLSTAPSATNEYTDTSGTINASSVFMESYVSASTGLDGSGIIEAGTWTFNFWASVSVTNNTNVLDYNVYKRSSLGVETLLFTCTSANINSTSIIDVRSVCVKPSYVIASTDRLVVKIFARTTGASNRAVTFTHSGSARFSNIVTPMTVRHNALAGLEGGAGGHYYHSNQGINTTDNVSFLGITATSASSGTVYGSTSVTSPTVSASTVNAQILKGDVIAVQNSSGVKAFELRPDSITSFGIGTDSLPTTATGINNVAVGNKTSSAYTTARDNTAIGFSALTANQTGYQNTAVGGSSMITNVAGLNNVAIGWKSLYAATSNNNVAIGSSAGVQIGAGGSNVVVGKEALQSDITGSENTAIGYNSLYTATGGRNIALGAYAGRYETGSDQFYLGSKDRTDITGDRQKSLLWGTMADLASNQQLVVNGEVKISDNTASALSVSGTITTSSISAPIVTGYTWPVADGTSGQFIKTNGSKVLSFADGGTAAASSYVVVSADYTATANVTIVAASTDSSAPITITLPSAPSAGQRFSVLGKSGAWQIKSSASQLQTISEDSGTSTAATGTIIAQSSGYNDSITLFTQSVASLSVENKNGAYATVNVKIDTSKVLEHYNMDEASGDAVATIDVANNLTQTGTIGSSAGKFGNSRGTFNDSNYYKVTTASLRNMDAPVDMWLHSTNSGNAVNMFWENVDTAGLNYLKLAATQTTCFPQAMHRQGGATEVLLQGTNSICDDDWHYVFAGLIGASFRLYVDGQLAASKYEGAAGTAANGQLSVGTRYTAISGYYIGLMDDVTIYKTTAFSNWTDAEKYIKQRWDDGRGRKYAK